MPDRAALVMVDLALKAVKLRLKELEVVVQQLSPGEQDVVFSRIQQLKACEQKLENRIKCLQAETQDPDRGGAADIYPAVQDILSFIQSETE